MPAAVSKTLEKALQKAMPGWKILKEAAPAGAASKRAASPDASSPSLAAVKSKFGKSVKRAKSAKAESKGHGRFVTVTPANLPDNAKAFHKVVLVKGDKIIAVQG